MKKIPTVFKRDPKDPKYVKRRDFFAQDTP